MPKEYGGYKNPSRKTFHQICQEMVYVWVYNLIAQCPTRKAGERMGYKNFPTPDYCSALIVYSSAGKNPEMKEPEKYEYIPWRTVFSRRWKGRMGLAL